MKTKAHSISLFRVPFQSILFSCNFEVPASTKAGDDPEQAGEGFAPRRCFGRPERIRVIHRATR